MNVLFVSGHPAQVHNFRLVREMLIRHGHQVFWLTTDKDIATNLLNVYGIPYRLLQKPRKNLWGKIVALVRNVWFEIGWLRKNKIDVCVSRTCPYTCISAKLLHKPHIILDDTEHAAAKIQFFARMANTVIVPQCFYFTITPSQIKFAGNIELFYCHPKRYCWREPWSLLGVKENTPYAVVRFVKWDAYHDVNLTGGFTNESKIELVKQLAKHIRVFISSEAELPEELENYRIHIPIERMHDVLCSASLFIGESATMASESVVLGTPAIYVDEIGRGYTDEECANGLLYMFRPETQKNAISKAAEVISPDFDMEAWKNKQKSWLDKTIDPTAFLCWFIENYPESERIMHSDPDYQYRFR